jgi:hypothetical protein
MERSSHEKGGIVLADSILKKEISFGVKKEKYPSKRSINLAGVDEDSHKTARTWGWFAIYLVCLALFVRFGVYGPIQKIYELENTYNQDVASLETLQEANSNYEEVRKEYSHYGNGYLNDEESVLQDRMDMLEVVETQLLDQGALAGISISDNTAELTINSEKLGSLSTIVANLESSDIVSYVTVSSSADDEESSVMSTMTITFKDVGSDTASETTSDSTAAADTEAAS